MLPDHARGTGTRGQLRLQLLGCLTTGHRPDAYPVQDAVVGRHLLDKGTEAGATHAFTQGSGFGSVGKRTQLHHPAK